VACGLAVAAFVFVRVRKIRRERSEERV
jgi:hypothetical protein